MDKIAKLEIIAAVNLIMGLVAGSFVGIDIGRKKAEPVKAEINHYQDKSGKPFEYIYLKSKDGQVYNFTLPLNEGAVRTILNTLDATIYTNNVPLRSNNLNGTSPIDVSEKPVVEVPISELRYVNNQKLRSADFTVCSAVILDYGDSGVMAHVKPYRNNKETIDAENVVTYLSDELRKHGIDPRKSEAIVNTGFSLSLESIKQQLKKEGIKLRSFSLETRLRDVEYNPKSNELNVFYKNNPDSKHFR